MPQGNNRCYNLHPNWVGGQNNKEYNLSRFSLNQRNNKNTKQRNLIRMDRRGVVQSWVLDGTNNPSLISVFSFAKSHPCSRTRALFLFICCFSSLFCHSIFSFLYIICIPLSRPSLKVVSQLSLSQSCSYTLELSLFNPVLYILCPSQLSLSLSYL